MAVHAFSKRGRPVAIGAARLAPDPFGCKAAVVDTDGLVIESGQVILSVIAVRTGFAYEVPVTGFSWESLDGLVTATNPQAITGGGAIAAGGVGTVIQDTKNVDPNFATALVLDVEI